MSNENPFESPTSTQPAIDPADYAPRSRLSILRWAFMGFALGATPPALLGAYGLYDFSATAATLPPETAACGNYVLDAAMMIFGVAPMTGLVGGMIAAVAAVNIQPKNRSHR